MPLDFFFKSAKENSPGLILNASVQERGSVFLESDNYKHSGMIIGRDKNHFFVSHDLSRDEVFNYLKEKKLTVRLSAKGHLYAGKTRLDGLGLRRNYPVLKLRIPRKMILDDPRKAYRLSTIGMSASVSFSLDEKQILSGRIIDISVSGAAIRPDSSTPMDSIPLDMDLQIYTDIQLEEGWSIFTISQVRNYDNYKIGIEFGELDKRDLRKLYKYIQKMRRKYEEAKEPQEEASKPEPVPEEVDSSEVDSSDKNISTGKPIVVIFGNHEEWIEKLKASLKTRFDVYLYPLRLSEIRNRVHLEKPIACFVEIGTHHKDTYRQIKKIVPMLGMKIPCMFFTENLPEEHVDLYFKLPEQKKSLLDLNNHQTLQTYKTIESFIRDYHG